MILSATTLKIISTIIATIISLQLAYHTFIYSYKWQTRHGNVSEIHTSVTKPLNLFFQCNSIILIYYLIAKFLHDKAATIVLLATSLLALLVLYRLMGRRFSKLDIRAASILLLVFTPVLCMGTTAAMIWLIPDVTTVYENAPRNYHYVNNYEWRAGKDMKLTGSYLDNRTDDTLYRMVVSYAIPGEDLYNVYSISDTIAPKTFDRIKARADYYMHHIPPFMRWSTGRMGRYRTQRVFIVDKPMLSEFVNRYDMSVFGLGPHRRVDSIKESNNRTLHEDPERLNEYRRIINALDSQKNH